MKLLCDEMLVRLGRWLRAAGYDTALAPAGTSDDDVLALALREERVLLSCDRALVGRVLAPARALHLPSSRPADCVPVLEEALGIDWRFSPWSRCLACNVLLEDAEPGELSDEERAATPNGQPLFRCPACRKLFWEGPHVARLERRLEGLRRAPLRASDDQPGSDQPE